MTEQRDHGLFEAPNQAQASSSSTTAPVAAETPAEADGDTPAAVTESPAQQAAATPAQVALKPLPPADLVCAYNFAVGYFHTRAKLIEVRASFQRPGQTSIGSELRRM